MLKHSYYSAFLFFTLFILMFFFVFYTPVSGDDILSITIYPNNIWYYSINWNSRLGEILARSLFIPPYYIYVMPFLIMLFYSSIFFIAFQRFPNIFNFQDSLLFSFIVFLSMFFRLDIGIFTIVAFFGNYGLPSILFALTLYPISLYLRNNIDYFKVKKSYFLYLYLILVLLTSAMHELTGMLVFISLCWCIFIAIISKEKPPYFLYLAIPLSIFGILWCSVGGLSRLLVTNPSASEFSFLIWLKQVYGYFTAPIILMLLLVYFVKAKVNIMKNIKYYALEVILIVSIPIACLFLKTYSIRVHTLSAIFLFAIIARMFLIIVNNYKYGKNIAIIIAIFTVIFLFKYDFINMKNQYKQRELWESMVLSQLSSENRVAYVFPEKYFTKSQHSYVLLDTKRYPLFPYAPYMMYKYNIKEKFDIIIDENIKNPMDK